MTLDERRALRRKALWTVGEFARYAGLEPQAARRLLLKYDEALGGQVLRSSAGTNRRYTFFWAVLARHAPDAFVDSPLDIQDTVDRHDDLMRDVQRAMRIMTSQLASNTRDIERLKRRAPKAA